MFETCVQTGSPGLERSGGGKGADGNKVESAATSSPAGKNIDSVDVSLEHNTLVIMWPPTQEEWRHEVRHGLQHMHWKVLCCQTPFFDEYFRHLFCTVGCQKTLTPKVSAPD